MKTTRRVARMRSTSSQETMSLRITPRKSLRMQKTTEMKPKKRPVAMTKKKTRRVVQASRKKKVLLKKENPLKSLTMKIKE